MSFIALVRCPCGATAILTSEQRFGRTVEICSTCGYEGVPRGATEEDPSSFTPRGMKRKKLTGMCQMGCGRKAKSPGARHCRRCTIANAAPKAPFRRAS